MYKKLIINSSFLKNSFIIYQTSQNLLNTSGFVFNYKYSSATASNSFFDVIIFFTTNNFVF